MSCEHETEIEELKDAVQKVNEAAANVAALGYDVHLDVAAALDNTPRLTLRVYKEL